jgi:hypothetical protein
MGRHCNISIAFNIQRYNLVSPTIRENMNIVFVGNLSGIDEVENLLK